MAILPAKVNGVNDSIAPGHSKVNAETKMICFTDFALNCVPHSLYVANGPLHSQSPQ